MEFVQIPYAAASLCVTVIGIHDIKYIRILTKQSSKKKKGQKKYCSQKYRHFFIKRKEAPNAVGRISYVKTTYLINSSLMQ